MFYAEIDKDKKCFHVTDNELPLSDAVIVTEDGDVLGKVWDGSTWKEVKVEEPVAPNPTQLDRIESTLAILTADTVTEESISTAISEGVNEV